MSKKTVCADGRAVLLGAEIGAGNAADLAPVGHDHQGPRVLFVLGVGAGGRAAEAGEG